MAGKKMKKIVSYIVVLCLAFSLMQVAAVAEEISFADMPDNWATDALQKAANNGLLSGYDDGTIRPDNNLTRAEMAAIMVRAFRV